MAEEKGVLTVKLGRVALQKADLVLEEAGISAGAFVELMVSDTGCGMDEATVERIFEPYFTTKGVGHGTGMGLALVHGIVQGCGGFVRVESLPGKGTTFRVYFPAINEEVVAIEEEQQELLPGGNERILVVDDEEDIIALCQEILEKLGYKVSAYCSSEKTLEVFRLAPDSFDLVITDQTMPYLSGSELAKEIRQIRPAIPIILCTGYSSMISEEKAREIGVERYMLKPFSKRELAVTVREVLEMDRPNVM
jgi:CheY-like chemotaxis protein